MPGSPGAILRESMDLLTEMAREKGLSLTLNLDANLPKIASVDPDRIRQILLNLVGNALKFTQKGGVRLDVKYDPASTVMAVRVADSGPGIPADRVGQLFQRFSQVDASSTRRHGGTGLGLAICKGLVEAMDGAIGVESVLGTGSCFWFTLPLPVAHLGAGPARAGSRTRIMPGCRILVADDNALNRKLVSAFLQQFHVELTEVADGAEAVEAAMKLPYDVILMDLRMPVLDGNDAAAAIRRNPGPNSTTPILAFSADSFPVIDGDIFDAMVPKPLSAATLIDAIAAATGYEIEHQADAAA